MGVAVMHYDIYILESQTISMNSLHSSTIYTTSLVYM
jgi:hypothetical protein